MKIDEMNTTVVSLDDYSFKYLIENNEYSFPGTTDERKIMDYIAFYRTQPVSAITHYGKIKELIQNAEVDGRYRLLNFGDRFEDDATKITFENIYELKTHVKSVEGKAIQGRYYTRLKFIKKARTIPELWRMKKR